MDTTQQQIGKQRRNSADKGSSRLRAHRAKVCTRASKVAAGSSDSSELGKTPRPETEPPRRRKRFTLKMFIKRFCLIAVLIVAAFAVYSLMLYRELENFKVPERGEPYTVEAGMTPSAVVYDLAGQDYARPLLYVFLKVHAAEIQGVQRGQYALDGSKTLLQLLDDMHQGKVVQIKPFTVLLVEGATVSAVQQRLTHSKELRQDAKACFDKPAEFMQEVLSPEELEFIGGTKDTLEGLLLPATYPYYRDGSARAVVTAALQDMVRVLQKEWEERDSKVSLKSPYEALILASIVERESSLAAERSQIAAVFYNRLDKGMKLQTDPAVMYGVSPDFRGPLRASHLRKDTPYNTYTRTGLPPTPIAMPGREAIHAVLHPSASKALFFVAKNHDPVNGHIFSASLREHNKAVASYKKAVRDYKKQQAEEQKKAAEAERAAAQAAKQQDADTAASTAAASSAAADTGATAGAGATAQAPSSTAAHN